MQIAKWMNLRVEEMWMELFSALVACLHLNWIRIEGVFFTAWFVDIQRQTGWATVEKYEMEAASFRNGRFNFIGMNRHNYPKLVDFKKKTHLILIYTY